LDFITAFHAARCVARRGMRSHSVPIAMAQTLSTVGDILDRGGERM